MKKQNSAINLLEAIGGTASNIATIAQMGWEPNRKKRGKVRAAGAKLMHTAMAGRCTLRGRRGLIGHLGRVSA